MLSHSHVTGWLLLIESYQYTDLIYFQIAAVQLEIDRTPVVAQQDLVAARIEPRPLLNSSPTWVIEVPTE